MNLNRRCETCTASVQTESDLQCRYNPPEVTVVLVPETDAVGRITPRLANLAGWPSMKPDQFCMKWAPVFKLQS